MALSPTYRHFFERTIGERHVFLQGGRRSGKTWATFQWLRALGGLMGGVKVIVLCYQLPQLRLTIEDFESVTHETVVGSDKDGYNASTDGVKWVFIYCDDKAKAQGSQCDFLFVNEAVNFPDSKGILDTYAIGVREQIIYNYNPTKSWKYGSDRITDRNMIQTTWKDNEANLTPYQLEEFEAIKARAMRPNASPLDIRQYQVYYLGNFSTAVGAIFPNVTRCSLSDYKEIPATETFGIDFGFATNGDPTTCMGCKIYEGTIYFRQYIYERGLVSDIELANRLHAFGFDSYTTISGDYGGMGAGRMRTLRTADNGSWTGDIADGFNIINAIKGNSVMDSLSPMIAYDEVCIVEGGEEAWAEFSNYELGDDGKPHGADHAIDAGRYAFAYNKRMFN